jgi:hypothetical protein
MVLPACGTVAGGNGNITKCELGAYAFKDGAKAQANLQPFNMIEFPSPNGCC